MTRRSAYSGRSERAGLPGVRTARHSSSVRLSGYDMFLAGVEVKREPKKGIDGMDRKGVILAGCWSRVLLKSEALGRERETVAKRREKIIYVHARGELAGCVTSCRIGRDGL